MTDDELEKLAQQKEGAFVRRARSITDFRYDEQQEKYWDITTGALLNAASVDGAVPKKDWPTRIDSQGNPKPMKPSAAINDVDTGLTVEGATWWPGKPRIIENLFVDGRGAQYLKGAATFNAYNPPPPLRDGPVDAKKWVDHVRWMYGDDAEHFFDFCAHAIQRPGEKVNHGIILAGGQGIGKDLALEPLRRAVGPQNYNTIGPDAILGKYNDFVKSVVLIINEVRPFRDGHKTSAFYDLMKPVLACPPHMLAMERKYANVVYVPNVMHVFLTTNHALSIYIPEDDRRYYVMDTHVEPMPLEEYYALVWWYDSGGAENVARWLAARDLSAFSPAAPPPMTQAKQMIIDTSTELRASPTDEVLDQFLEAHGYPDVFFPKDLIDFSFDDSIAKDNSLPHRAKAVGYALVKPQRVLSDGRVVQTKAWRRGEFYSRAAYVKVDINDKVAAVEAAMKKSGA